MKASSVGWELEIKLSDEETSLLKKETINGQIKVYDRDKKIGNFPLELKIAGLDEKQLYIELKTIPEKVYVDKVEKYIVKISKDGYEMLKEYKSIGDRMADNPGCKVSIKKLERQSF